MKYPQPHRKLLSLFSNPITALLSHTPITGNQITFFRLFLALPIAYLFSLAEYRFVLSGALLLYFALVLDFVDGGLARKRGRSGKQGTFWDYLIDRLSLCIIVFGIIANVVNTAGNQNVWVFGFGFISLLLLVEILHLYEVFLLGVRREESIMDSAAIMVDSLYIYAWIPHVYIICFFGFINRFDWYLIVTAVYVGIYFIFSVIKQIISLKALKF